MKATWFLIISWVLVYFALVFAPNQAELLPKLAYSTENVMKGYFWTPITSIFIHADFLHLFMNSLAFVFFGLATEKELGSKKMLAIFFIGAIAGDMVSSLFYSFSELSIGASGGVSAVLGAAIFVAPFRFSMFPYIMPTPIVMVGIMYIITNLIGLFTPIVSNISYAAHIGGLALGVGYGFSKVGTKKGLLIIIAGFVLVVLLGLLISQLARA